MKKTREMDAESCEFIRLTGALVSDLNLIVGVFVVARFRNDEWVSDRIVSR